MADADYNEKLSRLQDGFAPRVLELCSGAGGLALGFRDAGFGLRAHMELSESAALTYSRNLLGLSSPNGQLAMDMVRSSSSEIRKRFAIGDEFGSAFDVLIAGLPCQAFARIGRSKLRSVAGSDNHVYTSDPRAHLYKRFLEMIEESRPLVVVLENVPDILNFGGHNVPEEISQRLDSLGYESAYSLLNAAHFGVPQYRERLFLVAYHRSLGIRPSFPTPSHGVDMRRGHRDLRVAATKFGNGQPHFVQPLEPSDSALPAVTAEQALGDLPEIAYHLESPVRRPAITETRQYATDARSAFSKLMRGGLSETHGHLVRVTPRDFETFRRMQEGDEYPAALAVAEQRWRERVRPTTTKDAADNWRREIIPPYDPTKFSNKWWKLVRDEPSRTLTAHLGRDTYSHIHFDSDQRRMVSVREAARLQSFPDWFSFSVSMNDSFAQIGNAVPPLLGRALAVEIMSDLRAVRSSEQVA